MLRNLKAEMARAGLNTDDLGREIGRSGRAVRSKISGTTSFTMPEAMAIRLAFFPTLSLDYLFASDKADPGGE